MSKIDWSKAPEGATHYYHGSSTPWRDLSGDKWKWFSGNSWHCSGYPSSEIMDDYSDRMTEKPSSAWSGEGLPPVGTVCEINNGKMGWVQCEIIAHKHFDCGAKPHAIAWIDVNNIDQSEGIRFRKIKSPEQIANDERKKAVMEMISDGGSTLDVVEFVGRLYDANYRKQEAK